MQINADINAFVWGPVMLFFICAVGVYFTVRTKFFQVVKFGMWNKHTLGLLFQAKRAGDGAITPFQAFCTAMAATAGTGNLVGVATSILLGGPGAIFWMFISGFFGMMTKFAEITLAIHFRERNAKGDWVGGPMYYITKGLGPKFKWLAVIFAFCGAVCAFGIGNMTQINAAVGTTETALIALGVLDPSVAGNFHIFKLVMGIVLACLLAAVILGGLKRIGNTTEFLVPFIGLACILGSIIAIIMQANQLPEAIRVIFAGAFQPQAVGGGVLGYGMAQAIRYGIARGVFTNEAGLGSAPIAHAAADVDHPVKQGMWGCFEVFADTLIMCMLSALVILTSGTFTGPDTVYGGASLISAAFQVSFGLFGPVFMAFSVCIFAFCTTTSWSLYGLRCFEYLTGGKGSKGYQILFCLIVVVAAVMQLELAWDIADTLNGMMAIPNLCALIGLSGLVVKIFKDYMANHAK